MPTQAHRNVSITSALAEDVLLFRSMSGTEALGRLSEFRVQLLSTDNNLNICDVLGKPMTVNLETVDGGNRHFNGVVTRFCSTGWYGDFATYEATLHPWLWLLTRASDCRIFQATTVIDIIKLVCQPYESVSLSFSLLSGQYEPLPYCVQYRETDFDFVCRLMEDAGIYFYFTHTADSHTFVLADSYSAHQDIPGYGALEFVGALQTNALGKETVSSWLASGEIQSGSYTLQDFDFEKAQSEALLVKNVLAAPFSQALYERFDYPGKYNTSAAGTQAAKVRLEVLHGQGEIITAQTDAAGVYPGGLFTLAEHPRADQNRTCLATSMVYLITGGEYVSGTGVPVAGIKCTLTAIGKEYAYRPQPMIAKPLVHGLQTALVVGKAGEEIWTDQYGRIKVQFHWDRQGKQDESSSCWVRVSQSWAGKGWGSMFIPRVGMEVVVSFLEGDPDRPLVTGCVYNSGAMPPYALPGEQTKSTLKSNSSKGGSGFNELRFEDKAGAEEVFVHAQKDFSRVVLNDDALEVSGKQTVAIKGDQTVTVNGDQSITVNKTIVIEATTSIELKVGGSSIKIEPAQITLKSTQITLNAEAGMQLKAGATMDLDGGGMLTAKAGLVKIN